MVFETSFIYIVVIIHLKKESIVFEMSCVCILWCMIHLRKESTVFETSCVCIVVMIHLKKESIVFETSCVCFVVYDSLKEGIHSFRNVVCIYCSV